MTTCYEKNLKLVEAWDGVNLKKTSQPDIYN